MLRAALLVVGGASLALALYAHFLGDIALRTHALSPLALILLYVAFRPKPKPPAPEPVRRAVSKPAPPRSAAAIAADEDAKFKDDELYIVFSRLAGHKTGDAFRAHVSEIIRQNRLPALTDDDISRLADEIDRRDLRGKTFVRTPGVALARMQRADLDVEYGGTSWLGGLPTLDDTPWPRDDTGRAMHHLAQIDLGTVPEPLLPKGMPRQGALMFFMTTATDAPPRGKVVYLPKIANVATEPPEDLVPIYHGPDWGKFIKGHAREDAPDTFPRWPVEFILLPMTNKGRDDDAHEHMQDMLPHQAEVALSPMTYRDTLPAFAGAYYWETAHRFTMSVRLARDDVPDTLQRAKKRVQERGPRHQGAVDTIRHDQVEFSEFVDAVSQWAVVHEPWDRMTPEDVAQLAAYFAQVHDDGIIPGPFKPFYQFSQGAFTSIEQAATATLIAAANAPPEVYRTLPFEVRADIDTCHRIAGLGRWHQMFGLAHKMGTGAPTHTHHHLLLQLHSDPLVNWMWGDDGIVQFWITDDDLLAQNWDAVEMSVDTK